MNGRVSLLLGVHAHQPVGNFPEVLDDAHARCYRPFLHTLHGFPEFRFAVHFSGWLLEYLFDKYPDDMGLLREMVERGQVEVFGGGDMEPVLASVPGTTVTPGSAIQGPESPEVGGGTFPLSAPGGY